MATLNPFIVTQKGLIVVDSQSWPGAARSLYSQFKQDVEALPVRYLINTHHHLDHAHGNAAHAEMFGSQIDIISTEFSRAALEQATHWFKGFLRGNPYLLRNYRRSRIRGGTISLSKATLAD